MKIYCLEWFTLAFHRDVDLVKKTWNLNHNDILRLTINKGLN